MTQPQTEPHKASQTTPHFASQPEAQAKSSSVPHSTPHSNPHLGNRQKILPSMPRSVNS